MMKNIIAYVLTDKNGDITRYSNIPGTGMSVIQDNPIIDMSKLFGYKIVIGDGNKKHLVFDDEKYNNYLKKENEKVEMEKANTKLNILAKEQLLPKLSDKVAYTVRMLYPEFEIGIVYKVGERIMYKGKFYKVILEHTSQGDWTPDVAVSLFVEIADPSIEYPEFVQPTSTETAYMKDDKITFNGSKYVSLVDYNVYSPTDYPNNWRLVDN